MNYNCPICGVTLTEQMGNQVFPGDPKHGVTLSCRNPNCSAAEVSGHGKDAKEANEIVGLKFKHASDKKR